MKKLYETIDFGIEGISPLKMDRWLTPDEIPKEPTTQEEYIELAKKKVYMNGNGLFIPANALEASMRHAVYYIAPKNKKTAYKDTFFATVHIEPSELPLGKKTYDEIVMDVVTRTTGKGKGDKVTRVMTYRPLIKEWGVLGQIKYLKGGEMSEKFLKDALVTAGLRQGLLGHRPKFGRFIVTEWKVGL